jgi:hypothetical protein
MKLVQWEFHNIKMPMIEDDQGNLFCTSKALCEALQTAEVNLRNVYAKNRDEFDENCVIADYAISFLERGAAK